MRQWVMEIAPDIVICSPAIFPDSQEYGEGDVAAAARAMGIPYIGQVVSWDNLSTKGTYHVEPDLALVWNEPMVREAIQLHWLKRDRLLATGAPTLDFWFDLKPDCDRDAFCRSAGLDPSHPYAIYLCSSTTIAADERQVIRQLASTLKANDTTRHLQLMIRPHPINAEMLDDFQLDNAVVFPRGGDVPDTHEARMAYFHSLHYAEAVIGVNTSAMVEATILDKPCVAMIAQEFHSMQMGLGHFHMLLDGGFMEIGEGYEQTADCLGRLLHGDDRFAAQRHAFANAFVRPWGLDIPAGEIAAIAIESLGARSEDIRGDIQRYVDKRRAAAEADVA